MIVIGMRANLILIASASEMSGLRMMKHLPSWEMPAREAMSSYMTIGVSSIYPLFFVVFFQCV